MNTACAPHCPQVPSILPHCHLGLLSLSICWPRDLAQQNYNRTRFACFVWLGASPPFSPQLGGLIKVVKAFTHAHTNTSHHVVYFLCIRVSVRMHSNCIHSAKCDFPLGCAPLICIHGHNKKNTHLWRKHDVHSECTPTCSLLCTHTNTRARERARQHHIISYYMSAKKRIYKMSARRVPVGQPANQPWHTLWFAYMTNKSCYRR